MYYNKKLSESFRGAAPLISAAKGVISKENVQKWLRGQDTYTLFKPVVRNFPRNKYSVTNIGDLWQCDLVCLPQLARYNDKVKYLLTAIDCFSRKAYVRPLVNKTADEVVEGFESIFRESKPLYIATDQGKEFISRKTQNFFVENSVRHYTVRDPSIKCHIVERFHRTLMGRLRRYMYHLNTFRYIDALQDIVDAYNNSKHSSHLMTPNQVNEDNILQVYRNLHRDRENQRFKKPRYRVGDYVRLAKAKSVFEKGYEMTHTLEIFRISQVIPHPVPVYRVKDLNNELVEGIFYEPEIQKIAFNPDTKEFEIDKILKRTGKGRNARVLVSWRGYNSSFDSWIKASDLRNFGREK